MITSFERKSLKYNSLRKSQNTFTLTIHSDNIYYIIKNNKKLKS